MTVARLGCTLGLLLVIDAGVVGPASAVTCPAAPRTGCRVAGRSSVAIHGDPALPVVRLLWRAVRVPTTGPEQFGDPVQATDYALCLYFGEALAGESQVEGGASWTALGSLGFRYSDPFGSAGPMRRLVLRGSQSDRASIRLIAEGVALPDMVLPVTVQLANSDTSACWESVYSSLNVVKKSAGRFRARYGGAPRPNIILINTDDQAINMLDPMTTVLDEIAAKGVTFGNSFVPTSICSPSRASILSGNYAHTHGVLTIGGPTGGAHNFVGPDQETIAVWLQRAGYTTGHFGKYINGYDKLCDASACYVPPGWDVWRAFPVDHYYNYFLSEDGPKVAYGNAPEDYSTDVLRDQVLAFLDEHPDEPVFVYFAPFAPHVEIPTLLPVPAPRHEGLLAGTPPWRPVSYLEADVSDKPAWVQALPATLDPLVVGFWDGSRGLALQSLLAEDEAISAILAKLAAQGRLTDTVVVFTSDNGYAFGEHRVFTKDCPYEECIRVPLAIRYDRLLREPGSVRNDLALNIDLAPTLAEWAQIPKVLLPAVDGLSLAASAEGRQALPRDAFLLEEWGTRHYSGVRTADWMYVRHETGERELYDLTNDPAQMTNVVVQNPALADQLEQRIVELGGSLPDQ